MGITADTVEGFESGLPANWLESGTVNYGAPAREGAQSASLPVNATARTNRIRTPGLSDATNRFECTTTNGFTAFGFWMRVTDPAAWSHAGLPQNDFGRTATCLWYAASSSQTNYMVWKLLVTPAGAVYVGHDTNFDSANDNLDSIYGTSSAGVIVADAWHWISFAWNVADSGGRAILAVDGVTVVDFTGDTAPRSTAIDAGRQWIAESPYQSTGSDAVYFDGFRFQNRSTPIPMPSVVGVNPQTLPNLGTSGGNAILGTTSDPAGDAFEPFPHHHTGEHYTALVGGNNQISCATPPAITGDLDLRADFVVTNTADYQEWFSVGNGTASDKAVTAFVNDTGGLTVGTSTNGTTWDYSDSTVTLASAGHAYGSRVRMRITVDIDNGASGRDVKFYTSADNVTWTQLGATVTVAGAYTAIHPSTTTLFIGRINTDNFVTPKLYRVTLRNGIDGTVLRDYRPADIDAAANVDAGQSTFISAASGETWSQPRATSGPTKTVVTQRVVKGDAATETMILPAYNQPKVIGTDEFTMYYVGRWWNAATDGSPAWQRSNVAGLGARLEPWTAGSLAEFRIGWSGGTYSATAAEPTLGVMTVYAAVVSTTGIRLYKDGTLSAETAHPVGAIGENFLHTDIQRIGAGE